MEKLQPNLVLGVDPGDTTGIAVLTLDGQLQWFFQYSEDALLDYLSNLAPAMYKHVAIENYITYKHVNQSGSKQIAARVIGMVTTWARLNKIPYSLQMAAVLTIAERWSKMIPRGAHDNTHWIDAYNHAYYWLVTNEYIESRKSRVPIDTKTITVSPSEKARQSE